MTFDALKDIFAEYEKLSAEADLIFNKIRADFPTCVSCKENCSDCCHALFDLSLVEAMYLNKAFKEHFDYGAERSAIISQANDADREIYRFKRQINQEASQGHSHEELLAKVGAKRQRCPLLGSIAGHAEAGGKGELCRLYAKRPITCKLYGIPTIVHGRSATCGLSRFEAGKAYPSANLDRFQDRLAELSVRVAKTLGSSYKELHMVYVPVSTALITNYNDSYLGIKKRPDTKENKNGGR